MDFRRRLQGEFDVRRARNARYSLRAFARFLGCDHSTLSQILRGKRPLTPRLVLALGARLRISAAELSDACVQQNAATILRLARKQPFPADSRWFAARTGIPLDEINTALHQLIYDGRLVMAAADRWTLSSPSYA